MSRTGTRGAPAAANAGAAGALSAPSSSVTRGRLLSGQIVAAYGRRYLVETAAGLVSCMARGRQVQYACGDRVAAMPTGPGEAVIEAADPRSTLFFRSVAHRAKLVAANASQVAVVVASEPSFSDELVARVLAAAECAGMRALLVLNKSDLETQTAQALARLEPFARAGYQPLVVSAQREAGGAIETLRQQLRGDTTVLVGQSGMGKSTLINALFPEANAATREISTFLASGKHTTTHARLYRLEGGLAGDLRAGSAVIDCPGLQDFGLAHLDWRQLAAGFREFRPFIDQCRFPDCRHQTEPGCAVAAAATATATATGGEVIAPRRLELYRRIAATEYGS